MYNIKNIVDAVNIQAQELETLSAKLKAQVEDFSAICLELIPVEIDSTIAYNFCLVYSLLTKHGFKFAGYCPSNRDLQWIIYRNETDNIQPCMGRLMYRDGQWRTDTLTGNFSGFCNLDALVKSSKIAFL